MGIWLEKNLQRIFGARHDVDSWESKSREEKIED